MAARSGIMRARLGEPHNAYLSLAQRFAANERHRGGDVFDFYSGLDGSVLALLADASSKGSLGTLHAKRLRDVFRQAAAARQGPADIIAALNTVRFDAPENSFQTVFASAIVCALPALQPELIYASAGHDVALVLDKWSYRQLAPTGPVLGIFPQPVFREVRIPFGPKATLVLGSDGITEARSAIEPTSQFGIDGIVVSSRRSTAMSSLAEAIATRLDAFCKGLYRDDATVAVLRRVATNV